MKICNLASGSKGNSTFISDGKTSLLIDAGLSAKQIKERMQTIGESPCSLSGILITHEHIDHVAGIGVLSKQFNIPIYANAECWSAIRSDISVKVPSPCRCIADTSLCIGSLGVDIHSVSHDAAKPVCYSVSSADTRCSVITDLGRMTKSVLSFAEGSDFIILEANHDPEMLRNGSYPEQTKKRIAGTKGHLSNFDAGNALLSLLESGKLSHVLLGHLSQENNTPELAYNTVRSILEAHGVDMEKLVLDLTWQERVSTVYNFV